MKKEIFTLVCGCLLGGCHSRQDAHQSSISREYGFTYDHIVPGPVDFSRPVSTGSTLAYAEPVARDFNTVTKTSTTKTDVLIQTPDEIRNPIVIVPLSTSEAPQNLSVTDRTISANVVTNTFDPVSVKTFTQEISVVREAAGATPGSPPSNSVTNSINEDPKIATIPEPISQTPTNTIVR